MSPAPIYSPVPKHTQAPVLSSKAKVIQWQKARRCSASPLTIPTRPGWKWRLKGDAIGGLMLFCSQKIFSGILADKSDILANLRGWQFPTQVDVIRRRVFYALITWMMS